MQVRLILSSLVATVQSTPIGMLQSLVITQPVPNPKFRGSNYVQGSLNWGPAPGLNGVSKTFSWWTERRKQFNEDFHTYALEWTEDFL